MKPNKVKVKVKEPKDMVSRFTVSGAGVIHTRSSEVLNSIRAESQLAALEKIKVKHG